VPSSHLQRIIGDYQFGIFSINREKRNREKKAVVYQWSALADKGYPAAAPWTCAA
jgi:hypothetical protein